MINEIKTIKVKHKDGEIELIPDWRGFLRLDKATGNAFKVLAELEEGMQDTDENGNVIIKKNIKWLPHIIQAMATTELTIEDIEKNILGMTQRRVTNMASIVLKLLDSELFDNVEIEENSKNVEENPTVEVIQK